MSEIVGRLRSGLRDSIDAPLFSLSVALLFGGSAAYLVYLHYSNSAFDLSARSEVVQVATGCHTQPRWFFEDARILADGRQIDGFSGQVELGPRAIVHIERIGDAPLRIMVQPDPAPQPDCEGADARALAVLSHGERASDGDGILTDPVEEPVDRLLVVETSHEKDTTTMMPFLGRAEVGQAMKSATRSQSAILLSGTVTFLRGSAFEFGDEPPHQAGSASLAAGDCFFVSGQTDPGFGFVRVDEQSAMLIGYRANGDEAEIERFGTRVYALSPGFRESLEGDTSVQMLLAVLGATVALGHALKMFRRKSAD